MNERDLVILCLATSVAGIIIMFIANKMIEPQYMKISEVTASKNYVRTNGTIVSIFTSKSGTTFIKLKDDTGIIDIVVFKDTINITSLKPGMTIEVIGKSQIYKEKIEIIPSIIRVG